MVDRADVFITGICGFVGACVATTLRELDPTLRIFGLDNLSRRGSELNRSELRRRGITTLHGDLRSAADLESLPPADWVIDAAALPSVLAGVDGQHSARQLIEHNLFGTVNLLEHCVRHRSGLVLLSTSRVYSIEPLSALQMKVQDDAFWPIETEARSGLSQRGISETFPTTPPLSLYGASKLASETLALEYGSAFGVPVWIDRCGVMAGAGQFARPDQGIFAFWLHAHRARRPLKYIGFDGTGHQVRDCLHPRDLARLILKQINAPGSTATRVVNVAGGVDSAMSLRQLTRWCDQRFGAHTVEADSSARPFDLPWVVLDASRVKQDWEWEPELDVQTILEEIAEHADSHPDWLETTS